MDASAVEAATRAWIEDVVVGLDLCPFAAPSIARGGLRIEVSASTQPEAIARDVVASLSTLQDASGESIESSLLVLPEGLEDFDDYHAFLEVAQRLLEDMQLGETFQIASFHPAYRFADAPEDDPANHSNRSPYPMLHFLREAAVSRALANHPDPEGIPARNVERLRALGAEALARLRKRAQPR